MRWVAYLIVGLTALAGATYAAFIFSPWPSVLLIRHAFDKDTLNRKQLLARHQPEGVTANLDIAYGPGSDEQLDLYYPSNAAGKKLPLVVWIHGGGFIYGDKSDVAEYLRILAARGYAAASLDYTLAPTAHYPAQLRQIGEALAFLLANSDRFPFDPARIFLAGDSAGAQLAAQTAAMVADPSYAHAVDVRTSLEPKQLRGAVLFCGVYDATAIGTEGAFGGFIRTVLWSYFGKNDMAGDPRLVQFSVASHVTPGFPPAFISVGNADPLAPQSSALAEALEARGVKVERLFFAADYQPPLPHEYQFNLDGEAGKQALERLVEFLNRESAG